MFRIRRIYDTVIPANKNALNKVCEIIRHQFSDVSEEEIDAIQGQLRNPLKNSFRSILFVAEDGREVKGFALLSHAPSIKFCFLDLLGVRRTRSGGGIGAALYLRVREEASLLNSTGLFLECLSDENISDKELLAENRRRMRFYEQLGARPIIGTKFEEKRDFLYNNSYFLLYDDLGTNGRLSLSKARRIVKAILERKYGKYFTKQQIAKITASFKEEPVLIREPKYRKQEPGSPKITLNDERMIGLTFNEKHSIHHIKERGYVESPVRVSTILKGIEKCSFFKNVKTKHFADKHILAVHDKDFFIYFKKTAQSIGDNSPFYPDVFPIRDTARPPKTGVYHAGYYCIDSYSPINRASFMAARGAVNCALSAASEIEDGRKLAYALIRPPGHHASNHSFGGFCYFNSTAIVANYLSAYGKVAILDIDYHHGNGTQDIFYRRDDVLTISIHATPTHAYPYFSGFTQEKGEGRGEGYNLNIPLPMDASGKEYYPALKKAVGRIKKFAPTVLVLALGFDPSKGDPTGSWSLLREDFAANGSLIGSLNIPTLIIQEGGYNNKVIGANAKAFFTALWQSSFGISFDKKSVTK